MDLSSLVTQLKRLGVDPHTPGIKGEQRRSLLQQRFRVYQEKNVKRKSPPPPPKNEAKSKDHFVPPPPKRPDLPESPEVFNEDSQVDEMFQCKACLKTFKKIAHLVVHSRTHMGKAVKEETSSDWIAEFQNGIEKAKKQSTIESNQFEMKQIENEIHKYKVDDEFQNNDLQYESEPLISMLLHKRKSGIEAKQIKNEIHKYEVVDEFQNNDFQYESEPLINMLLHKSKSGIESPRFSPKLRRRHTLTGPIKQNALRTRYIPPPPFQPPSGHMTHDQKLLVQQLEFEKRELNLHVQDLEMKRHKAVVHRLHDNKDVRIQEVEWELEQVQQEIRRVECQSDDFVDSRMISKDGRTQRWSRGNLAEKLLQLESDKNSQLRSIMATIQIEEDENASYGKVVTSQLRADSEILGQSIRKLEIQSTGKTESADSLGRDAYQMHSVKHQLQEAEDLYLKCLEMNPLHATNLGNYALFIHQNGSNRNGKYQTKTIENKQSNDQLADSYYRKALQLNPEHGNNLSNYATFLKTNLRDFTRAEQYYQRAIESSRENPSILGNFAKFLFKNRQDFIRAESLFKKALEIDPNHPNNLINYASFVKKIHHKFEFAQVLYQRVLEMEPGNAVALSNFANLLALQSDPLDSHPENIARLRQAKALYVQALESAPNQKARRNYAIFLRDFPSVRDDFKHDAFKPSSPSSPIRKHKSKRRSRSPQNRILSRLIE